MYEEKIINLIKQKSKKSKKIISIKEAEKLIEEHHNKNHNHSHDHDHDQKESKKSKKTLKSSSKNKKIRNK